MSATRPIRLRTLGVLEVQSPSGERLDSVTAQPKRSALLAYLAVESARGPCSRDTLVAMFWPELDETRARQNLRTSLHFLRRELGRRVLQGAGARISIDRARLACDAVEFDARIGSEDHAGAIELYGGDFLTGLHVSGCPEFERWQDAERSRLAREAIEATLGRADDLYARGSYADAERLLRGASAWAPFDERLHRLLVQTLVANGDRGRATLEHDTFRSHLARDLGAHVSVDTETFVERLLAGPAVSIPSRRTAGGDAPLLEPVGEDVAVGRTAWRHVSVLTGIAAVIAIGSILLGGGAPEPRFDANRVAIAPFANRSGNAEVADLGRIAADWVSEGLLETGLFEVVNASPGPDGERPADHDPAGFAHRVGAGIVVTGGVSRRGDSIYIEARALDVASGGAVLFAVPPSSAANDDPFHALGDVRSRIMGALASRTTATIERPPSSPPRYDAYRAFILGQGRYLDHLRFPSNSDDWYRARDEAYEQFGTAARLDTTFARPVLWHLAAYLRYGPAAIPARALLEQAEARRPFMNALETAQLDAYAAFMRYDWDGSLAAWDRLIELDPASLHLLDAARTAIWANRPGRAREILLSLDPARKALYEAQTDYWTYWTQSHHMLGLHEAELVGARELRALRPGEAGPSGMVLNALIGLGRIDEVRAFVTDSLAEKPESLPYPGRVLWNAARELRRHGQERDAADFFRRADAWFRAEIWAGRPDFRDNEPGEYRYWRSQYASFLMAAGRYAEARPMFEELYALTGRWSFRADAGVAAAHEKREAEARLVYDWLENEVEPNFSDEDRWGGSFPRYAPVHRRAQILAALGDSERTAGVVREALALGLAFGPHGLESLAVGNPHVAELIRPRGSGRPPG